MVLVFAASTPTTGADEPDALEPLAAQKTLREMYQDRLSTFHDDSNRLADRLAQQGDRQTADQTRAWPLPLTFGRNWLFVPPDGDRDANADANPKSPKNTDVTNLRQQYAADLWDLATKAAKAHQASLALQIAHHVVREDPQHKAARRLLGLNQQPARVQSGTGKTRHTTFGWRSGDYRWARSNHFQVLTTCDIDTAKELLKELERLYLVWGQLFAEFLTGDDLFQRAWEKGALPVRPRGRYRVVLFANRDEYVSQMRRWEPQVALSEGVYRYQQRTAFFYHDDSLSRENVRHEVVHQLFHEARVYGGTQGAGSGVAESQDFWAVEGIAMYFETMQSGRGSQVGYVTVGGPDAERLQFARHRALAENEYTPMATFTMMGRERLQGDPRVRQLYSQAAGWAHFLMDGQDQAYRPVFRKYLRDIYQHKQSGRTLAQRIQISFDLLDRQYLQFLDVTDSDLAFLAPETTRLSLGHTRVTDEGVQALGDLSELAWLDLSSTQITDAALSTLSKLDRLKTVWLAGTNVTDASIPDLVKLTQLQELDLRGTHVSPAGRRRLRESLPSLQTVYPSD